MLFTEFDWVVSRCSAEEFVSLRSFDEACSDPVLDVDRAVDGLGGNVGMFRDVATVFLAYLPTADEALSAAADAEELRPVLHDLGGSLGSVGAIRAHRLVCAAQDFSRRGVAIDLTESIALLREAMRASAEALSAAIAGPAGGARGLQAAAEG
jgi:hypothetical protein